MSNLENFKRFVTLMSFGDRDKGQTGGVDAFQVLGVASFWVGLSVDDFHGFVFCSTCMRWLV